MAGPMKVGSLFSGCDAMFLGVASVWPSAELAWVAEVDKDASAVLAARHAVPNLGDVTAVDWATVEPVDVLIGGPPCQAVSSAGKGLGSADPRWMWPEAIRAMAALKPSWCLWENPARLLTGRDMEDDDAPGSDPDGWGVDRSRGDAGWFGWILGQVAAVGFDAVWCSVRASDVGAPHRRDRVFLACTPADTRERTAHWERPRPQPCSRGSSDPAVALLPTPRASANENRTTKPTPSQIAGKHGRYLAAEVALLPTPRAQMAESRNNNEGERPLDQPQNLENAIARTSRDGRDWGRYQAAVTRWEQLTRPAPPPVDDKGRLDPRLPEWMLGLPDGWVTGTDIPRTGQLRVLGNTVQPQAVAVAIHELARLVNVEASAR